MTEALAVAKEIGTDIEFVLSDALPVALADDADAHHDAVVSSTLCTRSLGSAPFPLFVAGTALLEAGTLLEVKSCRVRTSNGDHDIRGRWSFKGREDGQHAALVDAAASYALVVRDDSRRVLAVVLAPATVVDGALEGRWYDIDRAEGTLAQLSWGHVLEEGDLR